MGSRSFLYGTYANWVELFQLAKACAMGFVQKIKHLFNVYSPPFAGSKAQPIISALLLSLFPTVSRFKSVISVYFLLIVTLYPNISISLFATICRLRSATYNFCFIVHIFYSPPFPGWEVQLIFFALLFAVNNFIYQHLFVLKMQHLFNVNSPQFAGWEAQPLEASAVVLSLFNIISRFKSATHHFCFILYCE